MDKLKSLFTDRKFWTVVGSIAVMAIIAIIYFYPDALQGNILQQHDIRQGLANGQEAAQFNAETGETTRWTNSLFGGMPTFQIAPSYPSDRLFDWINPLLSLGLPFPASLLFLMMLGFFILLMTMRMRWYVSLIGAIAYGFSSYFIILIGAGHIWKFVTLAFVPPTIAGLVLCYRGRYLAGSAMAALFGMLQIASNHVQMTYYFLFVILGFMIAYLVMAIREKQVRRWAVATGCLAVAGILAVTANLPSLYNTYEYSKETIRGGHSELTSGDGSSDTGDGLDRSYITQYSYGTSETFTLLIPNVKGGATALPMKGSVKPMVLSDLDDARKMSGSISPETAYNLQFIPQYFGGPEGTNGPVYVGALIVVLFIMGCIIVRGPLKWTLLALTILSILLAWGRNFMWLTDFMIDYIPLYSKFRTPESILVIAEFTMPLLGAMALQKLLSEKASEVWSKYSRAILWSFGIVLALCLAGIIVPGIYGTAIGENETAMGLNRFPELYSAVETLRHGMIEADAMRSFIIVAAGFGILMLYLKGKLSVGVAAVGIGIVVCGDLFMVNKRYLSHDSFMPAGITTEQSFPKTPADEFILADTAMNYRVIDFKRFTDADPSYHHKMIGGYHAAKLTRYQDILTYYFGGDRDFRNVLDMLNTRYVIEDPQQAPFVNPGAMGNAWFVDRIDYVDTPDEEIAALETLDLGKRAVADARFRQVLGNSKAKNPADTIFETSYAPNRLTYHAQTAAGGVAVFSEVFFPWGWHAAIDGKDVEIGRVNYLLRAIDIPAGSHTVEMWFDPESLRATTTAAGIAVILIYLLLAGAAVAGFIKKRDDSTAKPTSGNTGKA